MGDGDVQQRRWRATLIMRKERETEVITRRRSSQTSKRINVRVLSKNCPERERLLWPINESQQEVKVSAAS